MAYYEHLPIYRDAYRFMIFTDATVRNFSRYHKYTHGEDLRNTAREVVKMIIRANNKRVKTPVLEELRVTIEELKLIVRICKDVKAFQNLKTFETAVNQVIIIGRQAEGWLKSERQKESDAKK